MNFPGQKSLAITIGISTALMLTGLLFTNASHNAPLDELGCHKDPPQGRYHCHTGALSGKEFAAKEDAQRAIAAVAADGSADNDDFAVTYEEIPGSASSSSGGRAPASESTVGDKLNLPPPPAPATAVVHDNLLKIVSWKVKKRNKMEVDRIANVLAEVDIAVLHELDLDEIGRGPLHKMGDLLQSRIGEKICRLWFKNASGGKEKIGILWRNSTVAHVDTGGTIKGTCGEMAVIVPTHAKKGERVLASSLFFSKIQKKMFMLATANFDSKPGNLTSAFKSLENSSWPTIVIGDLRTPSGSATNDLKKSANFKTALVSINGKKGRGKISTENVWTRNATASRVLPVNLYERFKEMAPRDIDANVSDSFPLLAEVELVPDGSEGSSPSVSMLPDEKKTKKRKRLDKPRVVSGIKKSEGFDSVHEDLEAEAGAADGISQRSPASTKSAAKKAKKKKKKH